MKDPITDFDKEYNKERNKKRAIIAAGVLSFIAFCILIVYFTLPEHIPSTANVQGTVKGLTSVDTENGRSSALNITLDNGEEITIVMEGAPTVQSGRKVNLKKVTSTAGIDSYQILNYVEKN